MLTHRQGLCSELKHLYVAITRARNQLWFVERNESSVDPVLQALRANRSEQFVEVVKRKDPDVRNLHWIASAKLIVFQVAEKVKVLRAGGSVDPERWIKRGAHLLRQKNFADVGLTYPDFIVKS